MKNDKSDNIEIFPLTHYWWNKVADGTKTSKTFKDGTNCTLEFRKVGKKYQSFLRKIKAPTDSKSWSLDIDGLNYYGVFQKGYSQERKGGKMLRVEMLDGKNTDLNIDEPVLAFWIAEPKNCSIRYYQKCYNKKDDLYIREYAEGYEFPEYYYFPCDNIEDGVYFHTKKEAEEEGGYHNLGNDCNSYKEENYKFYIEKHIAFFRGRKWSSN